MPHLILEGEADFEVLVATVPRDAHRWGVAVLKTEEMWFRSDGLALLAEGVVVEHSRPLHPVAVISKSREETTLRLWRLAPTERTPAVQRWLAILARAAQSAGCGRVTRTNLAADVIDGVNLSL